MATSQSFAEKIKQLEQQGKDLLSKGFDSTISSHESPLPKSSSPLKELLNTRIAQEDEHDQARVSDILNMSIPVPNPSNPSATLSQKRAHKSLSFPSLHSSLTQDLLPPPPISLPSYRGNSLSQPQLGSSVQFGSSSRQQQERLAIANRTIDRMREELKQAQKLNSDHKRQFRVSTEEITRRLQDSLLERDRLLASKAAEASNQEALINSLQSAVTELHQTSESQKHTIDETEKQLEMLRLIKSDYDNMVDMLRTVVKDTERRLDKSFYTSEPISSQSTAMLVHTLERCIEEGERDRRLQANRILELEEQVADMKRMTQDVEKSMNKSSEEKFERLKADLESRLQAADERAINARSQSDSLKKQLELAQEQYRGSELLREEQNRMLEERVEMLKSHLEGERKDSHTKLESVSVALDSTNRDLTSALSSKDELVRRYAGMEERVKDYEVILEKLTNELEAEKEQSKRLWEKDNEVLNRNVELETKMALRDAEMARLEALLEKTKEECSRKINQEVALTEKYQMDKFTEEKTLLVTQVDSLTARVNKLAQELKDAEVENGKLLSQLRHTLEKLKDVERLQGDTSDDKVTLQSQLIAKNAMLDKMTSERDQYLNMLEQRNAQFNEISLACERVNLQKDERERHVSTLESTILKLEERLSQTHKELNSYQQENTTLHRTRDEFDGRIREMEAAVEKQTRKLKSKDKKIADADSEKGRLQEMLEHKNDTLDQLDEQLRVNEHELKEARREISMLSEECNALKSVIKGQEGEMQREINNLLMKIKAVENDYRLAKKALKSKEHVDKQASDVANKLQIELTDQRKYSDDLRSKIRWLEESVDAAKRERLGVEDQCQQLQLELEHRCKAEQRQQQIVMTERSKQVVSLEDGLKGAITRCSALQAAAEKSEQDIYKLKLKHQLELKELQRTGEQREGVTAPPNSPPRPQYDGVATELKTVLNDMKELLSSAQERRSYSDRKSSKSERTDYSVLSQSDGGRHDDPHPGYSERLHRKTGSIDTLLNPAGTRSEISHRSKSKRSKKVSEPLRGEAQALCTNLEKKLDQLARLGQETLEDSGSFVSKRRSSATSCEKLHRYLRSQKHS
ncbi:coiled-coil domain-containing protein 158-like [Watersipora subatra]|uniref:coiled-coil domain-containing protein 158-like n=1 Tax=Watersipora subatra TaxID=2589382 RepID=UPI00355B033C